MRRLTATDPTELAAKLAGNWTTFDSFGPGRQLRRLDPKNYCLVYTHHRDSDLIDKSNAEVIARLLEPHTVVPDDAPDGFTPDAETASCGHWAVGWIAGYVLRIRNDDGEFTDAFRLYADCKYRMENEYPILDEEHHSQMEHEATCDNVQEAVRCFARCKDVADLPANAWDRVMDWLNDNDPGALEGHDGQGGWPDDDELTAAFTALGYLPATTPE